MTTQFTQQEAIEAILNATKDGDLPLEDRLVLLCEIVKEQQREITHLRVRLEAIRQQAAENWQKLDGRPMDLDATSGLPRESGS